jgi:hypothetical protein
MKHHSHFETLCALAASGQLCDREQKELEEHIDECPDCNQRVIDLAHVSAQALMPLGAMHGRCPIPKGMVARFTARALVDGIPLSRPKKANATDSVRSLNALGGLTTGLLLVLLIVGTAVRKGHSPGQQEIPRSEPSAVRSDVVAPEPLVPALSIPARATVTRRKRVTPRTAAKSSLNIASSQMSLDESMAFSTSGTGVQAMKRLANVPFEGAHTLFLRSSIQSPEQMKLFSPTAFGDSRSKHDERYVHVFHYALVDQCVYLHRSLPRTSIQSSEQMGLFSPAAFEASLSKPAEHVFTYVPYPDTSPSPRAYLHHSFDWYQCWFQGDVQPLRFQNKSAQ